MIPVGIGQSKCFCVSTFESLLNEKNLGGKGTRLFPGGLPVDFIAGRIFVTEGGFPKVIRKKG